MLRVLGCSTFLGDVTNALKKFQGRLEVVLDICDSMHTFVHVHGFHYSACNADHHEIVGQRSWFAQTLLMLGPFSHLRQRISSENLERVIR